MSLNIVKLEPVQRFELDDTESGVEEMPVATFKSAQDAYNDTEWQENARHLPRGPESDAVQMLGMAIVTALSILGIGAAIWLAIWLYHSVMAH